VSGPWLHPLVDGVEPTIREEDMPTLLDGFTVQMILNSDYFRGQVCDAQALDRSWCDHPGDLELD